jgi:parvulin-like peptidyl-prolyl isomerase
VKPTTAQRCKVLLLALGLVWATGRCAAGARGPAGAPAVRIDDEEVAYSEFEGYLRGNFGSDVPPASDAETRSRLFDQFIEERLLLQRAEKERLSVGDEQVSAYLAGLGGPATQTPPEKDDPALKEQVRRNLLIQEYKDKVLLKDVRVEPSEVESYFKDHPEEFQQARVIVLRQILLEDSKSAKKTLEDLQADPAQFPVLAQRVSLSPDKGQPRPFQEEELPEPVRQAIVDLRPGQISREVEDGGKFRIFQLVDRREGKSQTLQEVHAKIEVMLLQRKAEETLRASLDEMRGGTAIRVHRENLPFTYRGEYGQ